MHYVRIRYQPDETKTLTDLGVLELRHTMNTDQYWGVLIMALVLLGAESSRVEITEYSASTGDGREVKLAYLAYAKGNYILAYDPVYNFDRGVRDGEQRRDWIAYFNTFQRHIPVPDVNEDDTDESIHIKESQLHFYFTDYFCRLVGKGDAIVRFRSLEFLQGAITFLNLVRARPHDHIFYVHEKTRRGDLIVE